MNRLLLLVLIGVVMVGCRNKERDACLERYGLWVKFGGGSAYCVEKIVVDGKWEYDNEKHIRS